MAYTQKSNNLILTKTSSTNPKVLRDVLNTIIDSLDNSVTEALTSKADPNDPSVIRTDPETPVVGEIYFVTVEE